MTKIMAFAAGLAVFATWMSIVGNPHVVETVIGLVLGVAIGVWVFLKTARFRNSQ